MLVHRHKGLRMLRRNRVWRRFRPYEAGFDEPPVKRRADGRSCRAVCRPRRAEKSNPVISAIERRDPDSLPPEIEGPVLTQSYIVQEQRLPYYGNLTMRRPALWMRRPS